MSDQPKMVWHGPKFSADGTVGCIHWSYDMYLDPFCMHPDITKSKRAGLYTRHATASDGLCGPDLKLHQASNTQEADKESLRDVLRAIDQHAKIPVLPPAEMLIVAEPKAPLPRLSAKARDRINETISIDREMGDRQIASDIEFLLEVHDRVHGIDAP